MQECSQRLADTVKKARMELGLTQEQTAEKSRTDVRTIINMEQGRGNPKFETLFALIHALKMDAREIFDETAKLDTPSIRHLRLLVDECSEEEAATLLPVMEAVLTALRSAQAVEIKKAT